MADQESVEVRPIANECQEKINDLLAVTKLEDCPVKEFLHARDVQRMKSRYKQWADIFGALKDSKSPQSLDYCLGESPVRARIISKTLKDLNGFTQAGN